jgi:type II secretory pathway component PulC
MVNSTEFDKEDGVEKLRYDQSQSRSAIPVISVTRAVADQILASQGKTFTEMEKALKTNHQPVSFATSVKIDGVTAVDAQVVETQNIVGYIKGSENPDQFVVVGAHFDHLGFGGSGTGSRKPDTVAVHNGADDNASGTALVMELARALAKSKPDKSILFMAFTAEEMGLIGSKYFTAHPLVDKSKIVAMVNMDMVGRLNDNKELMVGGTGTAKEADSLLTVAAAKYPFHIKRDPQGTGPSDHSAFYVENIPVLYFTSGLHDQYHTPEDDANLINYEGEATIGNLVGDMVKTYASAAKLTFQQAGVPQESNYRRRLKATLGVVPDHTADVKGFRIDGTRAGGPAATAGLQKGDVIVAIDGMEITNIYDYMYRLAKYSKGDRITVELIRDGEKKIFLIIL